ncbi:MAG: signal peptidase II [Chloroflexota bacterium]
MTIAKVGRPLWAPFLGLVAVVVTLDQLTKSWIESELSGGRVIEYLDGALRLVYSQNNGALFGLFRGQVLIFALLSLAVIVMIVSFHARAGRSPYMTLTLGLLLGGAIGNAVDRFRLGYVIDFVDGGLGTTRFFTFNLADASISAAILLLFAMAIWPTLAGPRSDSRAGTDPTVRDAEQDSPEPGSGDA